MRSVRGMRRDLVGGDEGEPVSFHCMRIHDPRRHFHKRTTEHYFVVEGAGEMELDAETFDVAKGDLVVVRPGTRHTSRPADGEELHIMIVASPAFGDHARTDVSYDDEGMTIGRRQGWLDDPHPGSTTRPERATVRRSEAVPNPKS